MSTMTLAMLAEMAGSDSPNYLEGTGLAKTAIENCDGLQRGAVCLNVWSTYVM